MIQEAVHHVRGSDDRVLFIAPEDSGTLSALRMGSTAQKIRVRHWNDIKEAVEYLEDNQAILANYDVAVDSLTEMQKMCMAAILEASATRAVVKRSRPRRTNSRLWKASRSL